MVALLALLALLTLGNAIVRYLTSYSFAFIEEASVTLLLGLALLGSTATLMAGRRSLVTFSVKRLPGRWRSTGNWLALAVILLLFGLLAAFGVLLSFW